MRGYGPVGLPRYFTAMRRLAGLPARPYVGLERHVLAHLAAAGGRFSSTLEFSVAVRGGAVFPYRFSYSFPAFGLGESAREAAACLAMLSPFGRGALRVARRILGLASPGGPVSQILLGIDPLPGLRLKLYLQLRDGRSADKRELARRVLPPGASAARGRPWGLLHLIGFDFTANGVGAVKLYFRHDSIPAAELLRRYPRCDFLRQLLRREAAAALRDFIEVLRVGPQGLFEPAAELDFGLQANRFDDARLLAGLSRRASGRRLLGALAELAAGRRWRPSRVSIPTEGAGKINLYYYLESERQAKTSRRAFST